MKSLQSILFGVALREVVGTTQQEVADIQIDSRKVIKDFGVIGTSIFKENMPESKKQEVAIKFLNAIQEMDLW